MKNLIIITTAALIIFTTTTCTRQWDNPYDELGDNYNPLPIVISTAVTSITPTTAISGGNIITDGGFAITARGVCWNTSPNPTISNSHTSDGTGIGTFTSNITGLNVNTTYYVKAYATNSVGTSYGNEVSFFNAEIGISFQGGILAYILQQGDPGYIEGETHGLIAAPTDQNTGAAWGCYGTTIGGTSTALGTGMANTIAIVNGCGDAGTAARICYNLTLNGYSDWYLPSKDELYKLYLNKNAVGGFADFYYWSSSEYSSNDAWLQFFNDGFQGSYVKDFNLRVRAVRAF